MPAVDRPDVPDTLFGKIRADPVRAPEYLALAAAERHGPSAAQWAATRGGRREGRRLAKEVKRTHARFARFGGAATGVGGWITMLPDLAGVGWIQSRMVFFIAAAFDFDPQDRMRPAELLVLWELYDDVAEAREALDGTGKSVAEAAARRAMDPTRSDEALLARLTRAAATHGGRKMAGRFIPGAAIVFNAVGNERSTRALADDAIRFYGGVDARP